MGMRATVAFVDKDKSVKVTSVQWSTRLDQTLGHMASESIKNDQDPRKVIAGLFRTITKNWNHVSAIEISDGANLGDVNNRDIVMGHNIVVNYAQKNEPQKRYASRKDIDIYNYHLDGSSIGAIYDMSTPDIIEFFWNAYDYDTDTDYGVQSRKCNINSLANFYSDVFNNPAKLKKLGNLRSA